MNDEKILKQVKAIQSLHDSFPEVEKLYRRKHQHPSLDPFERLRGRLWEKLQTATNRTFQAETLGKKENLYTDLVFGYEALPHTDPKALWGDSLFAFLFLGGLHNKTSGEFNLRYRFEQVSEIGDTYKVPIKVGTFIVVHPLALHWLLLSGRLPPHRPTPDDTFLALGFSVDRKGGIKKIEKIKGLIRTDFEKLLY